MLEAWADALADIPDDYLGPAFGQALRSHKDSYLLKPGAVLTAYGDLLEERRVVNQAQYADTSLGMEQPEGAEYRFNLWPLCYALCELESRLDRTHEPIGAMRMFGKIKMALQLHRWYDMPMPALTTFVRDYGAGVKGDFADLQDGLLPVEALDQAPPAAPAEELCETCQGKHWVVVNRPFDAGQFWGTEHPKIEPCWQCRGT